MFNFIEFIFNNFFFSVLKAIFLPFPGYVLPIVLKITKVSIVN